MNSVRSNSLSLKYQGFSPPGCQEIGIIKFEFVAKTQFLLLNENFKFLRVLAHHTDVIKTTVAKRVD